MAAKVYDLGNYRKEHNSATTDQDEEVEQIIASLKEEYAAYYKKLFGEENENGSDKSESNR